MTQTLVMAPCRVIVIVSSSVLFVVFGGVLVFRRRWVRWLDPAGWISVRQGTRSLAGIRAAAHTAGLREAHHRGTIRSVMRVFHELESLSAPPQLAAADSSLSRRGVCRHAGAT